MVRNLLHVHGSEKCVLHGRCNEFVMAGIACVAFSLSGATCHAVTFVGTSLQNDGTGGIW